MTAELKFYKPPADGLKLWNYVEELQDGSPKRNFGDADIPVTIHDIRGQENLYTLEENGFSALKTTPSAENDFASEEAIRANYFPEVERLLWETIPGVKRILLFDYTLRRIGGNRPPVLRVHIDQNQKAAFGRVRHFLPEEAETLVQSRVHIINVWRPLNGPVQCSPLAFADSKTVTPESFVDVEHRYPARTGETISVAHANEKWHYWSGMENDEGILLQIFDSEKGVKAAHTAFVDPRIPVGGRQCESIEVRALLFG